MAFRQNRLMHSSFLRQSTPKLLVGLLAILWLAAQLATAFHIGHDEHESGVAQEHSCVLCQHAHVDAALPEVASLLLAATAFFFVLASLVPSTLSPNIRAYLSRAPPAI